MALTFVQGDTLPAITAQLHQQDDPATPIPLDGATGVRFQMRRADDVSYTVDAAATIVNPALGTVRYVWGANDLSQPGEFLCQWEVTFADGRKQTNATAGTITVRRR